MIQRIKPILVVALLTFFLLPLSCSKDDGPEKKEEIAEQPKEEPKEEPKDEPKEEEPSPEESNKIVDNVIIKGGTKIEGEPPVPNGAISMDLSGAGTTAVVEEGFYIPLISDADIVGAYVQIKAPDAGISESYYDVDIAANQEENEPSGKRTKTVVKSHRKSRNLTAKNTDTELDIDLAAALEPGDFCYIICVYDAAGNISEPQEVCVTVQAFGGDEALVGTWALQRWESFEEGTTETEEVGEEYCDEYGCETLEYSNVTFNADGTYEYVDRYIDREVDGEYGTMFDDYVERGKWSYTEGNDLVIVEYYYSSTDEDGTIEETYAAGEAPYVGVVSADGIELTETTLTITDRYDDDGDGIFEEVYTDYYEKQ